MFEFAGQGLKEIKKTPVIQMIIATTLVFAILGRFYEIDKIYVANQILHIGAEGIVLFSYAMAAGSFIVWGNTSIMWLSMAANLLVGIFETASSIFSDVIFQSKVDHNVMGRVMAFYQIMMVLSSMVGIILAPLLVTVFGVGVSMALVGAIAIVCCIVLMGRRKNES